MYKLYIAIVIICIGIGVGIGYPLGQKSKDNQIDKLQKQLSECSSNTVTIEKVKGKSVIEIVQKQKESYNPYFFGCKQDTNGIIKYFCKLPRRERNNIEKNLK